MDINSLNKETSKDESITAAELVRKHIQNADHIVTDDEFNNIKVAEDAADEEKINKEADVKKDELKKLPDNDSLPNPYNVVA